ncbi:ABC transporter ATP-binding protein [Planomicrobium sp. Y74]|uniref:ABC transporter ATP-binding protein n=1 Tax=Planomicrobium sp. Y74 TaxID=2478977 RepID=UPI000EF48CC5|nr:ABC transporter ATP-binding protein [Planomicrobium sp. Y74]RLQ91261.1 ABC transporter ATP-binding protein [Planomicrobium sp. Y74]
MSHTIRIENLSKNYGKQQVLKDIDLTVGEGQIFGLIGPSGSGKTTLVKMIVGIDSPDRGTVTVMGARVPNLELLQDVGYMAQSDALYPELTGKENLVFFASLFGLKGAKLKERIAYVSKLVELDDALNKKVAAYSGGMKRRLSLAIALAHDPKLLILDEPTVGIDPELRQSVWQELLELMAQGKTIVLTTHVMDEAAKCEMIALVRDGGILASGSPDELKAKYGAADLEGVFLAAGRGGQ